MFPIDTKFLTIDDSSTMRKIIKDTLGELGYKNIGEADSGKTALAILQQAQQNGSPFQVIFCDSNMPKMKGLEVLNTCKSDPDLKKIPFFMVTVEGERHQITQAMKGGASEYFIKPFDAVTLKEKLTRVYAQLARLKA